MSEGSPRHAAQPVLVTPEGLARVREAVAARRARLAALEAAVERVRDAHYRDPYCPGLGVCELISPCDAAEAVEGL